MYEIETTYKLTLKRNLIYEHCKEAYKNDSSQDFDVTFITKDNFVIQAHHIIMALQSKLLQQLGEHSSELKILLPEYCFEIVQAFVIFAYTGEVFLPINLRNEFLSLCLDMMVDMPKLDDCIMTGDEYIMTADECIDEVENVVQEESAICDEDLLKDLCQAPDMMQSDDEYNVEDEKYQMIEEGTSDEEETIEDTIEDTTDKLKKSRFNTSAFQGNLKQAIEAVKKGELNTMQSARQYGIPKTTLYRWTKNVKKQMENS